MNTRIFTEWLPSGAAYRLAQGISVEFYRGPMGDDPKQTPCEIWIPVRKV